MISAAPHASNHLQRRQPWAPPSLQVVLWIMIAFVSSDLLAEETLCTILTSFSDVLQAFDLVPKSVVKQMQKRLLDQPGRTVVSMPLHSGRPLDGRMNDSLILGKLCSQHSQNWLGIDVEPWRGKNGPFAWVLHGKASPVMSSIPCFQNIHRAEMSVEE